MRKHRRLKATDRGKEASQESQMKIVAKSAKDQSFLLSLMNKAQGLNREDRKDLAMLRAEIEWRKGEVRQNSGNLAKHLQIIDALEADIEEIYS
jgi:hypothetical protein